MIIGVPDRVASAVVVVLTTFADIVSAVNVVRPVTLPPVIVALSAFCVAMVPMDVGGVGGKALEIKTQNAIMMIVQPVIIPIRSLMIPPIQSSNRSIT